MKILKIADSLPEKGAGAEHVAWFLSKYLSDLGHEVHLLVFGDKDDVYKKQGINIHTLKRVKNRLRYYLTLGHKKVKKKLEEIEPDILHAHTPTILAYILRNHSDTVLTLHNSDYEDYSMSFFERLKHSYFVGRTVKSFKKLTVPSERMKNYFENYFNQDFELIPNGVDISLFQRKDIEISKKQIIHVGRLIDLKNVRPIFELAKELSDYNFIFVGEGPLKNEINLPNVDFVGRMNPKDLPDFYSNADLSLFPADKENFPLVGLEAMSCGCIVLAHFNGFSEYIDNEVNGFLMENFSVEHLVRKIKEISQMPNRKEIRDKAVEKAKEYDWSIISKKYENFYMV